MTGNRYGAPGRRDLPADEAQQRRLATTAAPHDGHHLAPSHAQVDVMKDGPFTIGKRHPPQRDQRVSVGRDGGSR